MRHIIETIAKQIKHVNSKVLHWIRSFSTIAWTILYIQHNLIICVCLCFFRRVTVCFWVCLGVVDVLKLVRFVAGLAGGGTRYWKNWEPSWEEDGTRIYFGLRRGRTGDEEPGGKGEPRRRRASQKIRSADAVIIIPIGPGTQGCEGLWNSPPPPESYRQGSRISNRFGFRFPL